MSTREAAVGADGEATTSHRLLILALLFASGFSGLVYQVLWMKELGLLFGNTAQAAATTLAAFFLGIAAGGWAFGRRAARLRRPLLGYAALEAGVAVSALLYFLLLDAYGFVYGPLYDELGPGHAGFLAVKFLLAVCVLFPPALCMGGTLPMLTQHLVRRADTLGKRASALYAANTFGGALGAYGAAFHLVPALGFTRTYLVAVAVTAAVAVVAWGLGRGAAHPGGEALRPPRSERGQASLSPRAIRGLAFGSGFATLALEVLWTRMFAQVLQNSVYSFAIILVILLVALAIGASVAHQLASRKLAGRAVVIALLSAAGLSVALSPFVFVRLTEGLQYVGSGADWPEYLRRVFGHASVVMLPPGILLGILFPFLIKLSEGTGHSPGRTPSSAPLIHLRSRSRTRARTTSRRPSSRKRG